jgi:hypothetical protein
MNTKLTRRRFLEAIGSAAAAQLLAKDLRASDKPQNEPRPNSKTIHRSAKDTLTAVELNHGQTLHFKLLNGQTRKITLEKTSAEILLKGYESTLYHFTCLVAIDGHQMLMERYVGSQESFYQPYVVNGMRIWFDAVTDIFDFLNEVHGKCRPARHARFALSHCRRLHRH